MVGRGSAGLVLTDTMVCESEKNLPMRKTTERHRSGTVVSGVIYVGVCLFVPSLDKLSTPQRISDSLGPIRCKMQGTVAGIFGCE